MSSHVPDVVFAERESGPLYVDLTLPSAPTGRDPLIVWLHGGGWFAGDRHLAPDLSRWFAEAGFVMASIDYRLSGDALFPAPLHDTRAAIRFLRENAVEYGIDPDAIGLWGSSAGGHLAALGGLTGHIAQLDGEPASQTSAAVQAVMDAYGASDLVTVPLPKIPGMTIDPATTPEARLIGGPPATTLDRAASASPLTWVTPDAPPFLIAHGTGDPLIPTDQSARLHDRLVSVGADSTLYLLDGYLHGFLNQAGFADVPQGLWDAGRLEAEGEAPSAVATAGSPGYHRSAFSHAVIRAFFEQHLRR
jgi:acetyl esterase/lipase